MKSRPNLLLAVVVFACVLIAGFFALPMIVNGPAASARAETAKSITPDADTSNIRVIDGDTLEDMSADITYRLVNIDTPETGSRARCAAERDLGDRATRTARTLITNARAFETRPTGRIDRYGRTIAYVRVDGRDLGETLIADGLARPWRGRREPWCNADGSLIP
jgi:micrococcal nuclease